MNDTQLLNALQILLTRMDAEGAENENVATMLLDYLWADSSGDVRDDLRTIVMAKLTPDEYAKAMEGKV